MPLRFLKWRSKMSSKQYNLVINDDFDTKIPLYSDEAFRYGIRFHAKYIGTMDVPRPTSRVEIVAAMRRVRYEFKAKGVKKRKVTLDISTEGVLVTTRRKTIIAQVFCRKSKENNSRLFWNPHNNSSVTEIMQHPIYRIFYVSHDSSDLKIFSYIAREGATNVFKCNVFKSNKKSQAMRIVRTVGQAFEVCHKLSSDEDQGASTSSAGYEQSMSAQAEEGAASKEAGSEPTASTSGASCSKAVDEGEKEAVKKKGEETKIELPPPPPFERRRPPPRSITVPTLKMVDLPDFVAHSESADAADLKLDFDIIDSDVPIPLRAQHQLKLLHERLTLQTQQTEAAVAQLLHVRDQLVIEQAARCEAQERTHQLLAHNKALLDHISALVGHLEDREQVTGPRPINAQQLHMLPQLPPMPVLSMDALKPSLERVENEPTLVAPTDTEIGIKRNQTEIEEVQEIQNVENNNIEPHLDIAIGGAPIATFEELTTPGTSLSTTAPNDEDNLAAKLKKFDFDSDEEDTFFNFEQHFYQNTNAFPNIPPIRNHLSNTDLSELAKMHELADRNNGPQLSFNVDIATNSGLSISSGSKDSSGDDSSSEDDLPFIKPLSSNMILAAEDNQGRVRLIVPVTPPESEAESSSKPQPQDMSGHTLRVPTIDYTLQASQPAITRTTSERAPKRSEMMKVMKSKWTRHTTK